MEHLLYKVGKYTHMLESLRSRRDKYVRDARAAGASWAEIGAQLGISRQGARQAFEGNRSEAEGGSLRPATQPATVAGAEDEP